MRIYPLPFLLAAFVLPAPAALAGPFVQPPAYKECTQLAAKDPKAALAKADEWLAIDDGFAAHHCRAMALYGLGQFEQAAEVLNIVRGKIVPENIALRTYVAKQGAKAWVQAGRSDEALSLLTQQIGEMGVGKQDNITEARLSAELLLERARLRTQFGQTAQAVQDLDHAISLSPINADILMARALAFEQLRDFALAKQDAEAVLKLEPGQKEARALLARLK